MKAYGTGLLSSAGELEAMHAAELRPLDLEAASRREYDPTHFQPVLFCADSFDEMYHALREYFLRRSQAGRACPPEMSASLRKGAKGSRAVRTRKRSQGFTP